LASNHCNKGISVVTSPSSRLAALGFAVLLIAGCSSSDDTAAAGSDAEESDAASPDLAEDTSTTTDINITSTTLVLAGSPTGDDGPLCWLSFVEGGRAGGCRTGTLDVVEYSNTDGSYVESWNGVVSHVSVPDGWDVYTFHQYWAEGEEVMHPRQGFVHHRAGSTAAFYETTYPVIRYLSDSVTEYGWEYCTTWNQAVFDANNVEDDENTNDTVQCLHIDPDPANPDAILVVASDHPPVEARLEITYVPQEN
jgi:hypothetical protein